MSSTAAACHLELTRLLDLLDKDLGVPLRHAYPLCERFDARPRTSIVPSLVSDRQQEQQRAPFLV
jgi:hypothetical protein